MGYFSQEEPEGPPTKWRDYLLDEKVASGYASKLLPLAVGYSTALLDYFFRGDMEIRHALAHHGPGMTITGFDFEVKNTSLLGQNLEAFGPDSQGYPGQLVLAYEYVPAGETEPVHGLAASVCQITTPTTPYAISSTNDPINSGYVNFTATLPSDNPIPYGADKVAFTLVYSGRLGSEDEAVAAKRYDFTESNSRIAFYYQPGGPGNTSNIFSVLPDGSEPIQYTNSVGGSNGVRYYNPVWSSDGSMLAFETQADKDPLTGKYSYNVQVMDLGASGIPGNIIRTLTFTPPDPWGSFFYTVGPAFSPDNSQIATLVTSDFGGWAIVKFDIAGGSASYVKDNYRNFWIHKYLAGIQPAWSPQGDKLAYYIESVQPSRVNPPTMVTDIFTINPLDGSNDINLTDDGFSMNVQPAWSPDGEWMVFISDRDGGGILDIWVMDKDGGNKQKIRECATACWNPTFSPDGLRISFLEGNDAYRINLDNSDLTQLTNTGYLTANPSWSPYLE